MSILLQAQDQTTKPTLRAKACQHTRREILGMQLCSFRNTGAAIANTPGFEGPCLQELHFEEGYFRIFSTAVCSPTFLRKGIGGELNQL